MADLPELPVPHKDLAKHIANNSGKVVEEIIEPYRRYEASLRSVYAQDRQNPILNDPHLNVLPLFTEDTKLITTRARDLEAETEEEKSRYILPLPQEKRRENGSPATVANLAEFQKNFNVFSESSLADMDWSNVVAAGSSVVNCLLPVPTNYKASKRKLREYYHEKLCPASDVDLFLYGLTHDEAIEKMKQIERSIKDALLHEVTVVRTKYAVTIASQYPVRHVQIVLRVYKSVSEILTGFDIDAAGGAYDGKQVYVTPRALGSFVTQINHVDLSRRSPSYESRLSKYSHRGFENYWSELDRSRIDPTIFERSFKRTQGLARLLILERLPTTSARETYLNKRREERGRPAVYRGHREIFGNIKDKHEDEIADWLSDEDISNYHTFTVPYGERFNAKRIEKLCYTRDLLLNAEWNQPDERKVYLHRHPAFFGRIQDVVEDCCGFCPVAKSPEEIEVAEKEAEIYISGKISFLIDDPGRQQIGSFNPLTEKDWTDMAYVGNNARLCESIVHGDIDDVRNWLSQDGADPNQRDHTGRTPLHLAVMVSTPDIVRALVEHGSRLTARLADGQTALHLAASRGNAEMIKILMDKSLQNEEEEEDKKDRRRKAATKTPDRDGDEEMESEADSEGGSEGELVDDETSYADTASMATGSFVNVKRDGDGDEEDAEPDLGDREDEPDFFSIDALAWDVPCSPLHLAIVEGQEEAVVTLCDYGADSILPIKFLDRYTDDTEAVLTLTLALTLPLEKAKSMAALLLRHGATSSQSDTNGCTALHRYVDFGKQDLVDLFFENDKTGTRSAINHMCILGTSWHADAIAPLHSAIQNKDSILVLKMLNAGAKSTVSFESWLKSAKVSQALSGGLGNLDQNKRKFKEGIEQPLLSAIRLGQFDVAAALLDGGADPNTLTVLTERLIENEYQRRRSKGESALDMVIKTLKTLRTFDCEPDPAREPVKSPGMDECLQKFTEGTYAHWRVSYDIENLNRRHKINVKEAKRAAKRREKRKGIAEKQQAVQDLIVGYETLEKILKERGGKTFEELRPDIRYEGNGNHNHNVGVTPEKSDPKPYSFDFIFFGHPSMTEMQRDGYIELMEAAWSGDIEKTKSLTLQAWGPKKDQPPLKMIVTDNQHNNAFSLAFLRGHYETAKEILEVIKTQWSPVQKNAKRYKLAPMVENTGSSDDDSEADSDSDEPRVISEQVNKKFTIDNIGEVSMFVESHTKPLRYLMSRCCLFTMENGKAILKNNQGSIFEHVVREDDTRGLNMLLDWAEYHSEQVYKDENDAAADDEEDEGDESDDAMKDADEIDKASENAKNRGFEMSLHDFYCAMEDGKLHMVKQIIRRNGVGIPVDSLVPKRAKKAEKKKPKYYQGLSVYGKKRKDWAAAAGQTMASQTKMPDTPPLLLQAALKGNLESVEFFLGEGPNRLYSEFGKSKLVQSHPKLKKLHNVRGGFDRAISKWLGADNDLVIHLAVASFPKKEATAELLEYLVANCPAAIDRKNSAGNTPLMAACKLGRLDAARVLIKANADQSTRNPKGENILHALVENNPRAEDLRPMLELLDPELRSSLFLHRKSLQEHGLTPLHMWVAQACGLDANLSRRNIFQNSRPYSSDKNAVAVLHLLLEYSGGEELEMLNGAGDSCLHTTIMTDMLALSHTLIDYKPSLLYRENAVGRTPAEVAHHRALAKKFQKPHRLAIDRANSAETSVLHRPADQFAKKEDVGSRTLEQLRKMLARVGLSQDYETSEIPKILAAMGTRRRDDRFRASLNDKLKTDVAWDLCQTAMKKNPGSRRLVSLNEASDVAKRLVEAFAESRYYSDDGTDSDKESEAIEDDDKKEGDDFAAREQYSIRYSAWRQPEEEEKEKPAEGSDGSSDDSDEEETDNDDEDDEEL